jgi:hypothetical protein
MRYITQKLPLATGKVLQNVKTAGYDWSAVAAWL